MVTERYTGDLERQHTGEAVRTGRLAAMAVSQTVMARDVNHPAFLKGVGLDYP